MITKTVSFLLNGVVTHTMKVTAYGMNRITVIANEFVHEGETIYIA